LSPRITIATATRVLTQLRRDPRTIALLLVVPAALITLIKFVFDHNPGAFDRIGGPLVGLFPFITMFLVTSITMLRERTTGTLERLMTMPLAKLDILLGYGIAFGLVGTAQALITSGVAFGLLDLEVAGSTAVVILLAIGNALLGMSLGFSSAPSPRPSSRRFSSCPRSSSPSCCSAACSSPATRWPGRWKRSRMHSR
jgi:ABC-2 type transport system permease protein